MKIHHWIAVLFSTQPLVLSGITDEAQDSKTSWSIEIKSVVSGSFAWTIPDFPVITLAFRRVKFHHDNKELFGLINKSDTVEEGRYICTNHCSITANEQECIVLWQLLHEQPKKVTSPTVQTCGKGAESPSIGTTTKTAHTLPFKVLGTCYSKKRQNSLDSALNYMENNRHVFVDLQCEPENKHDINAIAVYLMYDNMFEKVGYIARELTQYVQPLVITSSYQAAVKNIRFRTNVLRVGYYLTIDITKQGNWDDEVIAASKKVK